MAQILNPASLLQGPGLNVPRTLAQHIKSMCDDRRVMVPTWEKTREAAAAGASSIQFEMTWQAPPDTTIQLQGVTRAIHLKAVRAQIQADWLDHSLNVRASKFRDETIIHTEVKDVQLDDGTLTDLVVSLIHKDGAIQKGSALAAGKLPKDNRLLRMTLASEFPKSRPDDGVEGGMESSN